MAKDLSRSTAEKIMETMSMRQFGRVTSNIYVDAVIARDERLTKKLNNIRERLIQRNSQGVRFEIEELNEIIGDEL